MTLKRFWIAHPAADHEPVGPVRWLKWKLSIWLFDLASRLEYEALSPEGRDDDIPF